MSFDLADVLKGVSNYDTGREQIEYLRLDQIDGDPHNFYLLGREEKVSNSDAWHTGTPEKPGWYICRIEVDGVEKPILSAALGIARITIREQVEQENPQPLTLDELRKMDGEPVYVVDLRRSGGSIAGWIVFSHSEDYGFFPRAGHGFFSVSGYGKRWVAYRSKPKE